MDEPYTFDGCEHEHTFACAGPAGWGSGADWRAHASPTPPPLPPSSPVGWLLTDRTE